MEFIIAQLLIDINANKYATGQSYRQTQNIDGGKPFVLTKVSYRNFQIAFKHGKRSLINLSYSKKELWLQILL